jgi:tetratricopeptide (TPR) repeat protein
MTEDRKLVPFDRGRRMADPVRMREFAATARKLLRERESSAELVERALRETPQSEWPRLAEDESMRNSGVLERLGKEVASRLEREPLEALAIANLATTIAETLAAESYPHVILAQMRAEAWKNRGVALSYVARYDEALESLDRAESQLLPFGTLAHDLAIVRFVRATTLQDVQRFEESLAILSDCTAVFHDHGDARRHLLCGIAEGTLLHRMRRYREAREAYVDLLETARELGDRESQACLHNNIGHASVEIDDFPTAEIHLGEAHSLFTALGQTMQALKVQLALGRMLVRRGDVRTGVARLRDTRNRFLLHGVVEEAGLCGLEIVEATLGTAAAEAEALAREIVAEFNAARLSTRAITALGYLTEAIAARRASGEMVAGVRDYIRSLRRHPEREFVAEM